MISNLAGLGKREAGGEVVTGLVSLRLSPDRPARTPLSGLSLAGFPPELAEAGIWQPVRMVFTMTAVMNTRGAPCMGSPGPSALCAYCPLLLPT